jgi:SAM-dependent methyltransferase
MSSYYFDHRVASAYDFETDGSQPVVVDDIPFYVGLAQEAAAAGHAVLELGCGTGRVTLPIARAGVEVTGVDNAATMLDIARGKSEDASNPRWVEAGMADFSLDQRFGLVIVPFRSFLLLLSVEEQKQCLARIRDHLLPGGRLALNFFNPSILAIAEWLGDKQGRWLRSEPQPGKERWVNRRYETAAQALDETRADVILSDEGAVIQRVERNLRLRWVYRYEMEHLLALTGFEVEALYGWFDRSPFTEESSEMVWLARPA